MRHLSIRPRVDANALEPTLALRVDLELPQGEELLLDLLIRVGAEDGRVLGIARPSAVVSAKGALHALDENRAPQTAATVHLGLPLSPRALDHIESMRSTNRKGDVVLQCQVEASWLASRIVLAPISPAPPAPPNSAAPRQLLYFGASGPREKPFRPEVPDSWLLSGHAGSTIVERQFAQTADAITISGSDWLHDYLAAWRSQRFVVVEITQAEPAPFAPSGSDLERLNEAIGASRKATQEFAEGDWNGVMEALRPVWELLRNAKGIRELLVADGYTDDAATAFNESMKQQFMLASKFIHRTDQSGKNVSPEIRAGKEEAILCYSLAMSILNLVSRKAGRLK